MYMTKISIIVPVYNVEKYLSKCLDSIVHQDISNNEYEIIIVNDGSVDESLVIANQFAKYHHNILIISQDNKGLSAARNRGLLEAKGKYVWFIDSDDWIKINCLKKLMVLCENNDLDILSIDRIIIYSDDNQVVCRTKSANINNVIDGKKCFIENKFQTLAQLYLFSKDFLVKNNLTFMIGILHEDAEFTPRAIYCAKRFFYSGEAIYFHLQREGSITNNVNPKRCKDLILIANKLFKYAGEYCQTIEERIVMYRISFFSLTQAALLLKKLPPDSAVDANKMLKKEREIAIMVLKDPNIIYKIEAVLFLISPILFSRLYSIIKNADNIPQLEGEIEQS